MSELDPQLAAQLADLPRTLAAHVRLTLVALALGIGVSLPLGIYATRHPRLERAALGVASVLQTIPGLALLALMVPLLAWLSGVLEGAGGPSLPSIGFLPAVTALALYSVLPMLRNTVTGLAGVDEAMREAARGVGMRPAEVLRQVELPLAMPTIVAGLRTATVWVVGMATLATPVGGTSLGNPIFAGLQTRNLSAVLIGSLAAAALALVLDAAIRGLEVGLARRSRARMVAAALVLGAVIGVGIAGERVRATRPSGPGRVEVAIGAKAFTEQYVLVELLAAVAESVPGVVAERVPSLGSTVAFDALVAGDLDLYVDYSGTIWATILGEQALGVDRATVFEAVERRLLAEHGVVVVAALGFENTYCLALRAADADARGLESATDLARVAPALEILGDFEFFERPEWRALEAAYGFAFGGERAMDSSLMYEAIRAGEGDVIAAYSTDGRIDAYDLRVLEDDRGVIPPYDAIVLANADFVAARPGIVARLRALEGRLDAPAMRRLNAAVDLEGRTPAEAAAGWLEACDGPHPASPLCAR